LLHLLGGLDAPTSGSVYLCGADAGRPWTPPQQGVLRNRHLGFVYQFHHLLPEFSALDNVAMPLRHPPRAPAAGARSRSAACWPRWVWQSACTTARPSCRAASASAWPSRVHWSPGPICVLADEPTGNLDRSTADGVFDLMLELAREQGTAFVLVTPRRARWPRAATASCCWCRGRNWLCGSCSRHPGCMPLG